MDTNGRSFRIHTLGLKHELRPSHVFFGVSKFSNHFDLGRVTRTAASGWSSSSAPARIRKISQGLGVSKHEAEQDIARPSKLPGFQQPWLSGKKKYLKVGFQGKGPQTGQID